MRVRWRTWCWKALSLASIGTLAAAPQPASAQNPDGPFGALPVGAEGFRRRFESLLLEVGTRDPAAAWQLARSVGTAAVPMLWDIYASEKPSAERRLLVLVAAMLAGEATEDPRMLAGFDKPQPEDRIATSFVLALLPARDRAVPGFWSAAMRQSREPVPQLKVAALLACARIPGAADEVPTATYRSEDPGVVAAALVAGAPLSLAEPFWQGGALRDHAELVWRGALVGSLLRERQQVDPKAVALARFVMDRRGESHRAAREAAALVLSRTGQVSPGGARPPLQQLQLLAAEPQSARKLREWLPPVPELLGEDPRRLAVLYVMSRDLAEVLANHEQWSAEESVRRHVAVAVALRLAGLAPEELSAPQTPLDRELRGLPEWWFARWAAGVPVRPDSPAIAALEPTLQAAARLAADGRLPRAAARTVLEETLWRWGSHPGLGLHDVHRRLVCDLMITGSNRGGQYQPGVPQFERYLPGGLGTEHVFFEVASELFDFLSRPVPPIPAECRLP